MRSLNIKQITLGVAMAFSIAGAQAATVTELTITGGNFGMNAPGTDAITAGALSPIVAGTYQGAGTGNAADSLADFNFGMFGPVHTFTAASVPGISGGGPAPSGTVDGSTITMDMSSFFAWWNGNTFNQGGTATGSYDATSGAYSMSWTSVINGGPFDTNTGYWTLNGNASVLAAPIPEPETYLMMLSGLGLLGVIARRRLSQSQQ